MERVSTWQGLGTEKVTKDYRELLKASDLDYTTVARDAYIDYEGEQILVPKRKVLLREDTKEIFGIVSDRYQICQNEDAFDFVDCIEGVTLKEAGGVSGFVWMIGELPEVEVLGDKITPNLIFQNSHDGSCSIKTTICMLRIACQNQFIAAFKDSPATISVKHYGDIDEKLLIARQTMQGVYDYVRHYDAAANELATKKVSPKKFNEIVEGYFKIPEDATPRTESYILDRREKFLVAYEAEDNQNFKGTKWGMINAYSDLITHEEYARKVNNWETNRFLNSLNPATMTEFMNLVEVA